MNYNIQGAFAGAAAAGQSVSTAQVSLNSGGHITTTSTGFVDATGLTLTLPNTGGTLDCLCNAFASVTVNITASLRFALVKDTTALVYSTEDPAVTGSYQGMSMTCLSDGDADTLKVQWGTSNGNTGTIRVTAEWATPTISAFAVG